MWAPLSISSFQESTGSRMKSMNRYFVVFILLLLILNIFFFLERDSGFSPEPYDLSIEAPHKYMSYPVYYVGKDRLVETREKASVLWRDKYKNIVDIYLAQADKEVLSRPAQIMDIPINKLLVTGDKIYLYTDLASFSDAKYNRENFHLYLMSLINSLTETGRGKEVFFIIDNKARAPEIYGIDMNQGFKYDESLVAEKHGYVDSIIKEFFYAMYSGDYQGAYRMLNRESRGIRWIGDFKKAFSSYVFHKNNEFPWDFLVEKTGEGYDVRVVFSPGSTNKDEIWRVSERYGRYIIDYPQELLDHLP